MKFPKLQKALDAMRQRFGIPTLARPKRSDIIQAASLVAKWNPNQKQRRKARRRAFAAGDRRAFA